MADLFGGVTDSLSNFFGDVGSADGGISDFNDYIDGVTQTNQQLYTLNTSDGSVLNADGSITNADGSITQPDGSVSTPSSSSSSSSGGGLFNGLGTGLKNAGNMLNTLQAQDRNAMSQLSSTSAVLKTGDVGNLEGANSNKPTKTAPDRAVNPIQLDQEWASRMRNFGSEMAVAKRTAATPNSAKAIISSEGDLY